MSSAPLRVGIISISHESNTFIPAPTTLELFKLSALLRGPELREKYRSAHHEIGGFIEILEAEGIEPVTLLYAHANPWGCVTDEALDALWEIAREGLDQAGPLDGILLAPHGAGVNESRPDMDGWWLARVREKVGALPIISTMDPHGNLSTKMVGAVDALISYRENPHLDQRQRGIEAARLMVRTLRGEIRPTMAAAYPPLLMNIECQLTRAEPMLSLHREMEAVRQLPGVLSASAVFGFPYADVSDLGSSFIVVTDNNPAQAQELADGLASWLLENRERFRGELISPEDAFERAVKSEPSQRPVGLLDMGDNVGGGAPGDSMLLVSLFENDGRFKVLVPVVDPEAVCAAERAGIGARLKLSIGGHLPMTPVASLETEVTVLNVCDGKYSESKPRHGGRTGGDIGRTAVVRSDAGVTFVITSYRSGISNSPAPFIAVGVDLSQFDVIILRGVHAPVGGFAEICPTLIRVNTPGMTTADMESLTFHHRREPLYPFEAI